MYLLSKRVSKFDLLQSIFHADFNSPKSILVKEFLYDRYNLYYIITFTNSYAQTARKTYFCEKNL